MHLLLQFDLLFSIGYVDPYSTFAIRAPKPIWRRGGFSVPWLLLSRASFFRCSSTAAVASNVLLRVCPHGGLFTTGEERAYLRVAIELRPLQRGFPVTVPDSDVRTLVVEVTKVCICVLYIKNSRCTRGSV